MACFPFMVEVAGQTGLVIGGGKVALHKINVLLPFGVKLRVVSEQFCDGLCVLADENREQVTLIQKSFVETDLLCVEEKAEPEFVCFVVAATDDEELQSRVSRLCKEKQIPVNVVDVREKSSFYFPAVVKQEELVISISTGGNSPAAAGYLKERIAAGLPDYYGRLIDNLGRYRELVLSQADSYEERKNIFRELIQYGEDHGGEIPPEVVEEKLAD